MTMKELVYNFFYFIKNPLSPKIKPTLFNTLTCHHSFANGAIALPILEICQKLAGGGGQREVHNFLRLGEGRGHEKWAIKRGRVMQIYARDHVEVHPKKKKEVLYLVKIKEKKKNNGTLWI